MFQFKAAGKPKINPKMKKHHFSIGTTLSFNLSQSLTEVSTHVTSESQVTTKNPELKIPPKIPLQSGRTVAIGPRKDKP